MSELRQRLLPIAKPPLALMGALRDFSASVTERVKSLVDSREVRRAAALLRIYTENLRRTVEGWRGEANSAASSEQVTGALVAISEGGRALMTLPAKGRELVKLVPEPVQLELRKLSTGGAHVCREIFAGILVVGMIAIVGGYGRLAQGPISMPSLVPTIEDAINGELSDLHVKIDDAILQRSSEGPGVLFRLRNIRLIDTDGSIVAQAPLAAIGMSGAALLSGRLAPGSVDEPVPTTTMVSVFALMAAATRGNAASACTRCAATKQSSPGPAGAAVMYARIPTSAPANRLMPRLLRGPPAVAVSDDPRNRAPR